VATDKDAELERAYGVLSKVLGDLLEHLDEVARCRADMSILKLRIDGTLMSWNDPDKTPVRPRSHSAMAAHRTSSEFTGLPPDKK